MLSCISLDMSVKYDFRNFIVRSFTVTFLVKVNTTDFDFFLVMKRRINPIWCDGFVLLHFELFILLIQLIPISIYNTLIKVQRWFIRIILKPSQNVHIYFSCFNIPSSLFFWVILNFKSPESSISLLILIIIDSSCNVPLRPFSSDTVTNDFSTSRSSLLYF